MPREVSDYDVYFNNISYDSSISRSTLNSTSRTNGGMVIQGGIGIALNANIGGNLNITGNSNFIGSLTSTDLNIPVVISKHDPAGGGVLDSYTFNTNSVQTKSLFGMVFFSYDLSIDIVVSGMKIALQISTPFGASRPTVHICATPEIIYLTQISDQLVTTDMDGSFIKYNSGTYIFKVTGFYFTS